MIYLVLILLSGVFSLIHIFKAKDKFAKVINATFVASIGVSFIPQPQVAIDGYYLFAIGCIMVVLYAFSDGNFSNNKKIVLIGSGLAQMIGTLFFVGRFPHTAYSLFSRDHNDYLFCWFRFEKDQGLRKRNWFHGRLNGRCFDQGFFDPLFNRQLIFCTFKYFSFLL
jgi:hypothetical protein